MSDTTSTTPQDGTRAMITHLVAMLVTAVATAFGMTVLQPGDTCGCEDHPVVDTDAPVVAPPPAPAPPPVVPAAPAPTDSDLKPATPPPAPQG